MLFFFILFFSFKDSTKTDFDKQENKSPIQSEYESRTEPEDKNISLEQNSLSMSKKFIKFFLPYQFYFIYLRF